MRANGFSAGRRVRAGAAAASVVLAALVGGCGTADDAVVDTAPTTSPTTPVAVSAVETTPGSGGFASHGGLARDHVTLVDNLRGRGLTVIPSGSVGPLLTVSGTKLDVSGAGVRPAELQSYDYRSPEAAAVDMATLTGDTPRISVMWLGPPHFFLRDRAFVTYIGSDEVLLDILTDLMGAAIPAR